MEDSIGLLIFGCLLAFVGLLFIGVSIYNMGTNLSAWRVESYTPSIGPNIIEVKGGTPVEHFYAAHDKGQWFICQPIELNSFTVGMWSPVQNKKKK